VPDPVPLVVPGDVGDDDRSEHPDKPIPRLNDMTAAVNRYFWFRIAPPFIDLQPLRSPYFTATDMPLQQPCGRLDLL
jgi:hypothetical protein